MPITLTRASSFVDGRAMMAGFADADMVASYTDEEMSGVLARFYEALPVDSKEAGNFAGFLTHVVMRALERGYTPHDAIRPVMHHALAVGVFAGAAEREGLPEEAQSVESFTGEELDLAMRNAEGNRAGVEPRALQGRVALVVDRAVREALTPEMVGRAAQSLQEAGMPDAPREELLAFALRGAIAGVFTYGIQTGVELERSRQVVSA